MGVLIFIASRVTSKSPDFTAWPSFTFTATTVAARGQTTSPAPAATGAAGAAAFGAEAGAATGAAATGAGTATGAAAGAAATGVLEPRISTSTT